MTGIGRSGSSPPLVREWKVSSRKDGRARWKLIRFALYAPRVAELRFENLSCVEGVEERKRERRGEEGRRGRERGNRETPRSGTNLHGTLHHRPG